jgi:hypothetical protein
MGCTCDPSYMGGIGWRSWAKADLNWNLRLYLKNNLKQKMAGGMALIEYLLSKSEVLSSNPSTIKKTTKKQQQKNTPGSMPVKRSRPREVAIQSLISGTSCLFFGVRIPSLGPWWPSVQRPRLRHPCSLLGLIAILQISGWLTHGSHSSTKMDLHVPVCSGTICQFLQLLTLPAHWGWSMWHFWTPWVSSWVLSGFWSTHQ